MHHLLLLLLNRIPVREQPKPRMVQAQNPAAGSDVSANPALCPCPQLLLLLLLLLISAVRLRWALPV